MGDGRDPTVATRILLDKLLLARCVQQQLPMVVAVQCSSSTVVNVPVIMRDSGNAPDSGHREIFGGHSSSQRRQVLDFPVAAMMGLFDAFCVIFSRSSSCPGVERTTVSARGLQWGCQIMTVVLWTYTHS